jgi:hypothetical protein
VSGTAEKEIDGTQVTKTFHWGFQTKTQYRDCQQAEESGQALEGLVVTEGGNDVAELTTHGDHFFYDRLAESSDPAIKTSLRFEEKAAADADEDGEITLEELAQAKLNLKLYAPSGTIVGRGSAWSRSCRRESEYVDENEHGGRARARARFVGEAGGPRHVSQKPCACASSCPFSCTDWSS